MAFNQYVANHKGWDHVGNVTPNIEKSEAHRPYGEFMPADWLPVGRFDKFYEEYFTVSVGKIVALDREERVVPAGLKVAFASSGGAVLTYSSADANEGVLDLATGSTVVSGGASYTRAQLTTALQNRGLIGFNENAEDFISNPVGVAPYNYWKWAGGDGFNPRDYHKHNFNLQSRVAILCKYVIELPHVPAQASQLAMNGVVAPGGAMTNWRTAEWLDNANLISVTRFASAGSNVIGLNLPVKDLAKNTSRTPVSFGGLCATFFVKEKSSMADLSSVGDYYIDYGVGVILVNDGAGTGAGVPTLATDTVDYFSYESAPGTVSTYACVIGDVKPGDYLVSDANSNFIPARSFDATDVEFVGMGAGAATDANLAAMAQAVSDRQDGIIGQVLDSDIHPRDYLERVRTAYNNLSTGVLDQMPGSASGGMPTSITYASAADKLVRILLLK